MLTHCIYSCLRMSFNEWPFFTYLLTSLWVSVTSKFRNKCWSWEKKKNHISIWIFIITVMKGVSLSTHWELHSIWSTEPLQQAAAFSWPSTDVHPPVEQMYIPTGFTTLVPSYIQVTTRSIDYILFVRALGVSMWKQTWLKCFNLNIPLFLIWTNFIKEIKKHY